MKKNTFENSSFVSSAAKYLLAALLIAVPLYPKFPLLRVPGTFVSVRLEDVLIAIATIVVIIVFVRKESLLLKNALFNAIFVFLVAGLVSLVSAIFVTQTVVPHLGLLHWMRRLEYLIPFFLAFYVGYRQGLSIDYYLKILLLVVIAAFLYGFGQRYLSWPIIITQNEEYAKGVALRWLPGSHISSTFAGHYDLATYLVLVLPFIVCAYYSLKGVKSKILLFLSFFSGLWLLVNSASRISLLSYIVSITISLLVIKKYKAIPVVVIISLVFIGFSSNLISRYQRLLEFSLDKFTSLRLIEVVSDNTTVFAQENTLLTRKEISVTPTPMPVFEDRSTNIRLNVEWPRALRAFYKNPLLGTGYSSITLATDNDYLRILGEIGLLGFIAFGFVFVKILKKLLDSYHKLENFSGIEKVFFAGYIGALPGIFINAVFIDVFEASKFAVSFWLITGLALGMVQRKLNE